MLEERGFIKTFEVKFKCIELMTDTGLMYLRKNLKNGKWYRGRKLRTKQTKTYSKRFSDLANDIDTAAKLANKLKLMKGN